MDIITQPLFTIELEDVKLSDVPAFDNGDYSIDFNYTVIEARGSKREVEESITQFFNSIRNTLMKEIRQDIDGKNNISEPNP